MKNSAILENKKNKYVQCLNNAINTANYLSKAINSLDFVVENSKNGFQLEEESGDGMFAKNLQDEQKRIYGLIVNDVIPGTKGIIKNLEYQISDALAKESMEEIM